MSADNLFTREKSLTVIGLGLMGASVAAAYKKNNPTALVKGFDNKPEVSARCKELGYIDQIHDQLDAHCLNSDFIVIAVHPYGVAQVLQAIAAGVSEHAIITDLISIKKSIVDQAKLYLTPHQLSRFVPAHPMAGSERSGPDAATARLFVNRQVILTPLADNAESTTLIIQQFWEAMGARVELMDVDRHDAVMGAVSHLPHIVAYSLVAATADHLSIEESARLVGGGYLDTTRIAASHTELWAQICHMNRDHLLTSLTSMKNKLMQLERALIDQNERQLLDFFEAAAHVRQMIGQLNQRS